MRASLAFVLLAACSAASEPTPTPGTKSPPTEGAENGGEPNEPTPRAPDATKPNEPASSPQLTAEPAWNDGTKCSAPDIETWKVDASTYVLRQSLCTNFEAPFMVLFVGDEKALLVDSGTGDADIVSAVDLLLSGKDVDLLVARSHAHGDHTGGEADLAARPRTTLLKKPGTTSIDLGNRSLDVIPIPGHEASHVAYYDAKTQLLLTGDTLYPGRLYVRDFAAYRSSIARLASFVDTHPISLVLGAHVELSKTNTEFKAGASTHPGEHALSLAVSDLRDLHAAIAKMSAPARVVGPRWVIVPVQ